MSLLCLDFGNTRVKWGVRSGDIWAAQGALPLAEVDTLAMDATRIVACNVAGQDAAAAGARLAARLGATIEWVRAGETQCGVTNGYERPQQLGADRWAALIGARHLHGGACLVVVSGTATTIDVLDGTGVFRGGLILPGLAMMGAALAAGTADLPAAAGTYRELPRNTRDAIASGALAATLGAAERMFRHVASESGACCVLSGGAAAALAPHLAQPARVVDNLVLEGLARIAAAG